MVSSFISVGRSQISPLVPAYARIRTVSTRILNKPISYSQRALVGLAGASYPPNTIILFAAVRAAECPYTVGPAGVPVFLDHVLVPTNY